MDEIRKQLGDDESGVGAETTQTTPPREPGTEATPGEAVREPGDQGTPRVVQPDTVGSGR